MAALVEDDPETLMLVVAADHFIRKRREFPEDSEIFHPARKEKEKLVTFGISPIEPHTGYGYIEIGEPIEKWL